MLHQIGVGALGPVFRTYEPERDRLVAVKAFRLDITPEQARALADELSRIAEAGLFHPSIVEPLGAGVEGTTAYSADEYVAAESLDVALRQYAPAPIDTALPFITQLAGALDFARAAGVGHGALHPRDVFVTPEEARATGFGIVEALEHIGVRAPVRRPYTAPERIAGEPWSTPADVFSLAAIGYELLTGRRPAGLGQQIGSLTSGTPNEWMQALHAVLARAMDEDPARRYPSALALASALESVAHGDLSAAAPVALIAVPGQQDSRPLDMQREAPGDADEEARGGEDAPADLAPPAAGALAAAVPASLRLGFDPEPASSWSAEEPADALRPEQELELQAAHIDDIATEREDDEAHHALMAQELNDEETASADWSDVQGAGDRDVDQSPGDRYVDQRPGGRYVDEDIAAEADTDRFIVEALGSAGGAGAMDAFRDVESRERAFAPSERFTPDEESASYEGEQLPPPASDAAGASPSVYSTSASVFSTLHDDGEARTPAAAQDWAVDRQAEPFAEESLFGGDVRRGGEELPAYVPHDEVPAYGEPRESRYPYNSGIDRSPTAADPDESRMGGLRLGLLAAVVLVLGLLAGLVGGYALWGRASDAPAGASGDVPRAMPGGGGEGSAREDPAPPTAEAGEPGTAALPVQPQSSPPAAASPTPAAASPSTDPAPPPAVAPRVAPRSARGTLVVRSTPSGAGVTVNGTWRGRTPLRLADLPLVRHDVRIVEPGFAPVSRAVALSTKAPEQTVTVRLQRQSPPATAGGAAAGRGAKPAAPPADAFTGSIYVDSRPRGATVAINGKPVGVTPLRIPEMRIGTHVVRLELPDHRIWASTARVTAGQEARVTGSLEPIQ